MKARWNYARGMRMLVMFALACSLLPLAHTAWAKKGVKIPSSLRQTLPIQVATTLDQPTIDTALAMQRDGWRYMMPRPKDRHTSWRNYNSEGIWWAGYWQNSFMGMVSTVTPYWDEEVGRYVGNRKGGIFWYEGPPPEYPDIYEWLLSSGGGPK